MNWTDLSKNEDFLNFINNIVDEVNFYKLIESLN